MKSVLLEMENKVPRWHPLFADFMASIGVAPRICKAYTPQTKGKVERSVGFFKHSYWAGVTFTDLDDLNRQAHVWCERANMRVHRTTHERPRERREREELSPLPGAFAWERFATEERKVSWDGYVSYDGVLYGLPSSPLVAGAVVQVREWHGCSKSDTQDNSSSNWSSVRSRRRMSSILINFVAFLLPHPGGRRWFPSAICVPLRRYTRGSWPSMISSVVWRWQHATPVETIGSHPTGESLAHAL